MGSYTLYIKVVEGHNLIAADSNGFSDPYALLAIEKYAYKTQVIKTTLNPRWNETFVFDGVQSTSLCNIRIKDWNRILSHKFLGSVDIALSDYVHGKPKAKWFGLQYYDPIQGAVPAGQVLLVIHLASKGGKSMIESIATSVSKQNLEFMAEGCGRLMLEVVEGRCLAVKDLNGASDPYCVITVGRQISKTNIIEKTLDPVWNEEFNFEIGLQTSYFTVELHDYDAIGKDDPMGVVQVNMKDLETERLKDEWFVIKPQTNEKVSGQLHLRAQYTSPQNSQKSYVIAKDNYVQLTMILIGRGMILAIHLLQIYESQELARSMTHLFNSERRFMDLLHECINIELSKPTEGQFRIDGSVTKLISAYFKWVDGQCGYLKSCILPVVQYIVENPLGFEIDPERTKQNNSKHLQDACQRLLNLVYSSKVPAPMRRVLSVIRTAAPTAVHQTVGRMLFLRFICAAVFSPESFGLLDGTTLNTDARRALTLVSKVVQNIIGDVSFNDRESFMTVFNPFIASNKSDYEHYILSASEYPLPGDEGMSFPVQYTDNEKYHHMAVVVKNLHNNFAVLSSTLLTSKEVARDMAYAAEVKLHFEEVSQIFAMYH